MIEAMACGTPVIAFENGSVPEVLEDAVTGFIVHSEDQAVAAVRRTANFDRARIRSEFERRFTAQRMAQNYLKLYARLAQPRRLARLNAHVAQGKALDPSLPTYRPAANAPTQDGACASTSTLADAKANIL
jgi:hypothetical protein